MVELGFNFQWGFERPQTPYYKEGEMKIKIIIIFLLLTLFVNFGFIYRPLILDETEIAFINCINELRIQNNLDPFLPNCRLIYIARSRNRDMIKRNYFSHYPPEGRRNYGFNLSEILGRAKPIEYGTPENFLDAWLASKSHKEVILRSDYKRIGIAVIDYNNLRLVTIIFSVY